MTKSHLASGIASALDGLPSGMRTRSGSVFYTGFAAFDAPSDLYVLGLNPGGNPNTQCDETVAQHLSDWQTLPDRWSAYSDESWDGKAPGTCGMQPQMLHLFSRLKRDPQAVPASNVCFVRSNNEASLAAEKDRLIEQCWPVHAAVISALDVSTILCLGGTAGRWVREHTGATRLLDRFRETNARGWTSEAHVAKDGRAVVTVTHPSRANWKNPDADPTPLLARILARDND
ncbi:uracil-DNA glycosylase family protein [Sphingobium aromaticiconvertens]|uniref:uracil-DNA glycosylase family protein n=1 Tax=Sphingobium aromaticiconvertens TaxID=365341 RepID=UPI00301935B1